MCHDVTMGLPWIVGYSPSPVCYITRATCLMHVRDMPRWSDYSHVWHARFTRSSHILMSHMFNECSHSNESHSNESHSNESHVQWVMRAECVMIGMFWVASFELNILTSCYLVIMRAIFWLQSFDLLSVASCCTWTAFCTQTHTQTHKRTQTYSARTDTYTLPDHSHRHELF